MAAALISRGDDFNHGDDSAELVLNDNAIRLARVDINLSRGHESCLRRRVGNRDAAASQRHIPSLLQSHDIGNWTAENLFRQGEVPGRQRAGVERISHLNSPSLM